MRRIVPHVEERRVVEPRQRARRALERLQRAAATAVAVAVAAATASYCEDVSKGKLNGLYTV